jgi:GNAT superfamily N-acetyltransferase
MTDVELARIAIDSSWIKDSRGRIVRDGGTHGRPAPHLVIDRAIDGYAWAIGDKVPDELADALLVAITATAMPGKLDERPPAINRCVSLLEATLGPIEFSDGPCYVVSGAVYLSSNVDIRRSDAPAEDLRPMNPPGANWLSDEWADLLDGRLGPWAMALCDGRVVSICHSARFTVEASHAGVWTHADYRRRGYAAAVTAAWTQLLAPTGRPLFYGTSSDNISSQNVAAKLNLRLFAWTCRLSSPTPGGRRPPQ